jgi:hypothetical protein
MDYKTVVALLVVAAFTFALAGYSIVSNAKLQNRLLQECLADGHPEYYCRSVVRGSSVPPPVILIH